MNAIFEEAKQNFQRDALALGWHQHTDKWDTCLYIANGKLSTRKIVNEWLTEAIRELFPHRTGDAASSWREGVAIWRFSDNPDTTMADVNRVYDHAGVLYERSLQS